MSKPVLSIQVILSKKNDKENKVEFEVTDPQTKKTAKYELKDDSDESFTGLTNVLKDCLLTFQKVVPHKSTGFFKSETEKNKLLEKATQAQNDVLGIGKSSEKECSFSFNKVNQDMKDKLQKMIKPMETPELDKKVAAAVDKGRAVDDIRTYAIDKMKCSQYLGIGNINSDDKDTFLTKDGIITDGYKILPFTSSSINDGKYVYNSVGGVAYMRLWEIGKKDEYEKASGPMSKFGTYEDNEINNTDYLKWLDNPDIKQNPDTGFDTNSLTDPNKSNLNKLIDKNKDDATKLTEAVLKANIIKQFKTSKDPSDLQLNYVLDILKCKGTKYLGGHNINGVVNTDVYLTTDGIITDGYKILPVGINDSLEVNNGNFGYGMNYTLTDKNNDGTRYSELAVKMKKDKLYGGSSNKTRSKKQSNKKTRRLY